MCGMKRSRMGLTLAGLLVLVCCTGCGWGDALQFLLGNFGYPGEVFNPLPSLCTIPDPFGGIASIPC